MKNKVKRREFQYILNSEFITASPLVQSDCSVDGSAGNRQGSLLLFLYMSRDAQIRRKYSRKMEL